jgi:DNA mismatch repair protein MutS2
MLKIGDYVRIKNTNLIGHIIRINNNTYIVRINNKAVTISKELVQEEEDYKPKQNNRSKVTYDLNTDSNFNNEIMLRHKTKEEAIYELDKFIDSAIINKVYIVRIIHGKNGGILRKAVHEYLKNSNRVESYKLAGYFEGQFGVTIANLK